MKPETLALTQTNHRLLLTSYGKSVKLLRVEAKTKKGMLAASFLVNKTNAATLGQALLDWSQS